MHFFKSSLVIVAGFAVLATAAPMSIHPGASSRLPREVEGVNVADGFKRDVEKGAGVDVADGFKRDVEKGAGVDVADGFKRDVEKGAGIDVADGF